jgi:hypothetical protein
MLRFAHLCWCASVASIVVGASEAISVSPSQQTTYFAPNLARPTEDCGPGLASKRFPILSNFENEWFSKHLRAAGEPSLYLPTIGTSRIPQSIIRFTWLRTFHPPVVVRIERLNTAQPLLIAKQLSGAGGYDPGKVTKDTQRPLSRSETKAFKALFVRANIFAQPAQSCEFGMDGSEWIFEGAHGAHYHFTKRWSANWVLRCCV